MSYWSCNIDKRGRIVRIILGLAMLVAGILLLLRTDHDFWATGLCALGLFGLFEGVKGWCALRAMGINVPM